MKSKMLVYLGIFVGSIILLSLYGFWVATHPPKYITNLTPKDLGWKFEDITLTTSDGVKLAAWFVPAGKSSDKVIVLLHGYPADKANLLGWAEFLHQDFNLFFLDFRYFGSSEGNITTIGLQEQKDLEAAIGYLQEKGVDKIGAMGFSLGGAVAIIVGAKDGGIGAIVSDSAYASLSDMSKVYYKNLWILEYPLSALTALWSKIFLGATPSKISPEKAARSLGIPILLIHSRKDQIIPFENALKIEEALKQNQEAQFLFLEKGTHGALPSQVLEEYEKTVLEFFMKHL
ncbi:MAG: alpha/beta fold hydrolase [Candidatus Blackburnbacteria bacterium]|nr:alpha/beta fold hydrolase [Candidatus Blackburnbacteria bacterium]